MKNLKCITLEMSLKPFRSTNPFYIETVCRRAFSQWMPLLEHADAVSVLLWASDGSEILDYAGNREETFEWACHIGGANRHRPPDPDSDPQGLGLHSRSYPYMEHPPFFTYGILKDTVGILKRTGRQVTGKPIRVGATFDPGPEFAVSSFKYERHPEILMGNSMGKNTFVCCYGVLHGDKHRYAGFPHGIPEGTPFGTFFGRQSQRFLEDLGFDYIWLSNGFGFGTEGWGTTGAIFDGRRFAVEKMEETQQRILDFWRLFRAECSFRVETRGTNLTVGIDLASDAVNLKKIYEGGLNLLPPPNSPWAALDGDFGLELAGYLSRVAELPKDEGYLFRYYENDPWWMNSPWIDRYEGQPHDIYLPLAASRVDETGAVVPPDRLSLLTIDDSLGELPERCPTESIPHFLTAFEHLPDAVSPFLWVYPFREYSELAAGRAAKPFFEDWFVRGMINNGLPLSTVVSTDIFVSTLASHPHLYDGAAVVTPVPEAGSAMNASLRGFAAAGGKVLLYGSAEGADPSLLEFLNLACAPSVEGELELRVSEKIDPLRSGSFGTKVLHAPLMSDGCVDTVLRRNADLYTKVLASVSKNGALRVAAVSRSLPEWNGGVLVWIRGTNGSVLKKGGQILTPLPPERYFPVESLARLAAREFGYDVRFQKETPSSKSPVLMIHRHDNGFFFSGYMPDTTALVQMKLPLGAPLLLGCEARLADGRAVYSRPRAWHAECRAFVEQTHGAVLTCRETAPISFRMRRRIQVSGLQDATVRILPRRGYETRTELLANSAYPYFVGDAVDAEGIRSAWGPVIEARHVTGSLMISERHI